MPEYKFSKSVDTEHEVKLESKLIYAAWIDGVAQAGQQVKLEVGTALVGNGAKIKIKGLSEKGKKLGKISDTISNNIFQGTFDIPEDIELDDEVYFTVDLPKNGLSGESDRIPCLPPIEVSNMKWSASEARRGDILTLSADVKKVQPGTEVTLTIYEHDQDGAHDKITELPAIVKDKKIEIQWAYEYHEDTDEIPTEAELERYGRGYNPPEYFFTVKYGNVETGTNQESGLLTFKDYIIIELSNARGEPAADAEYKLTLSDGTEKTGNLDSEGKARIDQVPPGKYKLLFPNPD